ncbi:MAG TPA: 6-pyruvoyl tetrahydropterin synthase family protein [Candidatus Kapabacteria bacterium]|nr:6-pyruvoyl tetrahydropterin synthase family protein [Candidatus Kapabacteria bacterium]
MNEDQSNRTRIAKDFHWEMGHRLPFHEGGCRNIHGHSYRLQVVAEGMLDEHGMVIDYFDLKEIVEPLVATLDHAFLCDANDTAMLDFFAQNPLKHVVVPFLTTAENLAGWFAAEIAVLLRPYQNLRSLTIRVCETERTYAERTVQLR